MGGLYKFSTSAGTIIFAPTGNISATTAQTAIAEVDSEKLASASVSAAALTVLDDATIAAMRGTLLAAPIAAVKHTFLPAGAAIARTTNGAASATVETDTNDVMYDVFDFDSATSEGIAWVTSLEHWNAGTIKAKVVWTYAGTPNPATNVQWSVSARAFANDDAVDQAFGTAQVISDGCIAAGDIHISGATPAITVGGTPANGQMLIVQLTRDVGNDDLAADARCLGVWIEYTEASTEEAAW